MRPPTLTAAPRLMLACVTACATTACGGSSRPRGAPLPPGVVATRGAIALAHRALAARGVLGYGVAWDGDTLVTVELGTAFELVVRPWLGDRDVSIGDAPLGPARRVPLGPAALDVEALAVDARGRRAWVASAAGTVRAVELDTGRVTATWHLGARATAVAVSEDGRHVATGTHDGVLCLRRVDGALLQCVVAHQSRISGLSFHGVGARARLASSAWDGTAVIWTVPALAVVARWPAGSAGDAGHPATSINDVAFAPDGELVALARSNRPPVRGPDTHTAELRAGASVYARPDPAAVITLWRISDDTALALRGHGAPVTAVAWAPDGTRLVSGGWDRTVRLWDITTGAELDRYDRFQNLVRDVAIDRRGARAAVAAWTDGRDGPAAVILELRYSRLRGRGD